MRITKTENFLKDIGNLPGNARQTFEKQEMLFVQNWLDARLHVKKLKDLEGIYSFRVTRRYRVLFYFRGKDEVVFFAIGHRKDIYR